MQPLQQHATARLATLHHDIATGNPHEVLDLLRPYDDLHRLVHGRPAPASFINDTILRSLNMHLHGQAAPSEARLYQAIQWRIAERQPQFLGLPLQWQSQALQQWYNQARHTIGPSTNTPDENRLRAQILLATNLQAYTPDQARYKARLRQRINTPSESQISFKSKRQSGF